MDKYSVIGGFGFNSKPLDFLARQNPIDFFDINLCVAPFSLDDIADAVIAKLLITKNSANTPNILFAYSTGGLVAIRVGILQPKLIKQIILLNSTPKFMQQQGSWHGISPVDFNKMLGKLNDLALDDFMAYFTSLSAYPKKVNVSNSTQFVSHTNKATLLNLMNIILTSDLRLELLQLKEKVIAINSDSDVLIAKNTLPLKQIYLSDSSHLVLNQEQLLKTLHDVTKINSI